MGTSPLAADALDGAFAAAIESRDMPIVAVTGVAGAQLAARQGRPTDAAERLGAAAVLREALGEDAFSAAYARGLGAERDAALARLVPAGSDAATVRP